MKVTEIWPLDNKVRNTVANREWLKGRNKFLSGFCSNYPEGGLELHEGTQPKNHKGMPMKTCPHFLQCPCKCHQQVDQMFEMLGKERALLSNPEYDPVTTFVTPYVPFDRTLDTPLESSVTDDPAMLGITLEGIATGRVGGQDAALAAYGTPTGRARAGGLEASVHRVTLRLLEAGEVVTPKMVSEAIAEEYEISPPSTGAIGAAWNRWVDLGFATLATKPIRFVGFTGESSWEELSRLKARKKRVKRVTKRY